jgi:hypothetical protein
MRCVRADAPARAVPTSSAGASTVRSVASGGLNRDSRPSRDQSFARLRRGEPLAAAPGFSHACVHPAPEGQDANERVGAIRGAAGNAVGDRPNGDAPRATCPAVRNASAPHPLRYAAWRAKRRPRIGRPGAWEWPRAETEAIRRPLAQRLGLITSHCGPSRVASFASRYDHCPLAPEDPWSNFRGSVIARERTRYGRNALLDWQSPARPRWYPHVTPSRAPSRSGLRWPKGGPPLLLLGASLFPT